MKTVYVTFSNHFDLLWRRCWERDYRYQGKCFISYARLEELILDRVLALAEQGEGAYVVEQALTMRSYLDKHPEALPRLKALYDRGLFEMCGAGEAIIDVNQCSIETMVRNLASGASYCREVLGMPPLTAYHGDGFGSSAQFPQVIRSCGYLTISGLSYSVPDHRYWRGLDGSTVYVDPGIPGREYFFDHCYQEPCRRCQGLTPENCPACHGTGIDLPQNFYPPFEAVEEGGFCDDTAHYQVCSEEMLPPEGFAAYLHAWERAQPGIRYQWGTPRQYAHVRVQSEALVDTPPADQLAARVDNNPVQTGSYVSRIRIKQKARRCEAVFYGWEKALALTDLSALDRQRWESFFLELPLVFFHDAITGTHQDEAYAELLDRMAALIQQVEDESVRALDAVPVTGKSWQVAGQPLWVFNPNAQVAPVRVPLPVNDWREGEWYTAVTEDGRRCPITIPWHGASPVLPAVSGRLINGVGANAHPRPETGRAFIEADTLPPLAWSRLRIEQMPAPVALAGDVLANAYLSVRLGAQGITSVIDIASGTEIKADPITIGEVLLEEDEGDPWGTRKKSAFRHELRVYTHFLGALQFAGYQEAYYGGRYEPSLRFGHEEDPAVFSLEWYVTIRLLEQAQRVDFQYEIFWKTANRRIRVAFPTQADTDSGYYSLPGGWLSRDRYEQTETCLWSPNGDWPALHFVASRPGATGIGWAITNYGTPAARIEDGRLLISLLRSPASSHCLERYAQDYPMPTSGMRDNGWHHFTLSLHPFAGETSLPALALFASALNQAPPSLLELTSSGRTSPRIRIEGSGVELLCVKPLFDQGKTTSYIMRLLNLQPVETHITLVGADAMVVTVCDALERPLLHQAVGERDVLLAFHPFEIKTVQVDLE
jgi:alpha-mannosidase